MQPIIITSDKTSWSLRPLLHLARKYWPDMPRPIIGGYSRPEFELGAADFVSLGRFADYPVGKWSDGLINFLSLIDDPIVLLMMDDYWLNAPVNHAAIDYLARYVEWHPYIARLDVTGDRLGASNWSRFDDAGGLTLIKSDPHSLYHFSYQAALWRKSLLLECLRAGETPWQSEMNGDQRLRDLGYTVLGTTQPPMRYTIAVQQGKLALDGGYQTAAYAVPQDDAAYIVAQDWIPRELMPEWVY